MLTREFSRRADYAIRAAAALAGADTPVKRRELAERTRAPSSVLAQALADLVRARIVVARAGPSGGYVLARPVGEISVLEIVRAAGDLGDERRCVLADRPCADGPCPAHAAIESAERAYLDALDRATLGGIRPAEATEPAAPQPSLSDATWLD